MGKVDGILFSRLLWNYLKEVNIVTSREVCRICQKSMAVESLSAHVVLCQKRFEVSQKLRDSCGAIQAFTDQIRKRELQMVSKRRKSGAGDTPDVERLQVEMYRRMVRLLDGQISRKKVTGCTTLFTEINKIANYLRCLKDICEAYHTFNQLISDRHQLRQQLKKVEAEFFKL